MTILETWREPRPVKLTIADFLHLDETGAFDGHAKTELIDGVVVATNAQLSTHARVKSRLFRRLADAVEAVLPGYEAWVEVATAIPPVDMPEPDIVVTCFGGAGRTPVPVDTIVLLVEIADTTVRHDLGRKARLYAAAGVPEYWVADIPAGLVHRLWSPAGEDYARRDEVAFGAPLRSVTIGSLLVETDGL